VRLLAVPGSLRRASLNRALLLAAASRLPPDAELELFERLADVPPFDEDAEHRPPAPVRELREAIAAADAVLIATPEYNHSLPGQLKNGLDWASRPPGKSALRGKPVAAIGVSTGVFGGVWAARASAHPDATDRARLRAAVDAPPTPVADEPLRPLAPRTGPADADGGGAHDGGDA